MRMSKAKAAVKFITDPGFRFNFFAKYGFLNRMNDEEYIRKRYKYEFGRALDLNDPKTFSEKLQWLKLYDRDPRYSIMVDKYEVKKYVASVIGEQYIIPTLGVWDSVEDIDFDMLPEQFVLKCTHDSHGLVICKDKSTLDVAAAKKKLAKSLKQNYYLKFREWPYKNVKPRIIAEKYMEDKATAELRDYKFFCFDGIVKCYDIDYDRFTDHKVNFFNTEGEILKIGLVAYPPDLEKEISIPEQLEEMKTLAAKLSAGIAFLRTDFYCVDGQVLFGELTFFPSSGFGKFLFEGNDELLGSWLKLPEKRSADL